MELDKIIERILEANPSFDKEKLFIRANGNVEYSCEHGVGHTVYFSGQKDVHGCCEERCCLDYEILND